MKRLAQFVFGMLIVVAFAIHCDRANAQSVEVLRVLQDRGWHGVGGNVQVHQPTLDAMLPWVGVWERSAINNQYGNWLYVKVLINCEQWSQIPFAALDRDSNYVLIGDLTGEDPVAVWPEPNTEPHRTMTAVCALYGYTRPKSASNPGGWVER